ncbi:MAG TPA: ABC transporter ATP-binding protein [Trebonia sp.]|jgi:branched-chain amino acid transport system ATP-binding protein|nr:ABC transporter ATP-binding protein [Trebonia sp.]
MTGADALLSVQALQVRYGPALALQDVSLTVRKGDVVAVLGSNGAGKSTLARTVSGLVPAVRGTITFDGKDITRWPAHRVRRGGIVYLPEGRGIFPALTVTENIQMAADRLPGTQRRSAIGEAMELFPNLAARRSIKAGLLSGGEQQMLSLSRGLVTQPALIIADEMSLGLAPKMVDMVFDSLGRLKAAGVTMIIIEQFVHRALAFANQCVLLSRGQVAWQGAPDGADQEILARYLGESATSSGD